MKTSVFCDFYSYFLSDYFAACCWDVFSANPIQSRSQRGISEMSLNLTKGNQWYETDFSLFHLKVCPSVFLICLKSVWHWLGQGHVQRNSLFFWEFPTEGAENFQASFISLWMHRSRYCCGSSQLFISTHCASTTNDVCLKTQIPLISIHWLSTARDYYGAPKSQICKWIVQTIWNPYQKRHIVCPSFVFVITVWEWGVSSFLSQWISGEI